MGVQMRQTRTGCPPAHLDRQAPALQPAGGLQAQQPAAENHRLAAILGFGDHRGGVVEGAEPEHAVGQRLVVGPQPVHRRVARTSLS